MKKGIVLMKSKEPRPPILEPMKRSVRQRCSFGCVICGLPLYEYHHMIPYADTEKHEEDNITLTWYFDSLCTTFYKH